ncbi:uncharacterized protein LOC112564562 [Pomacea canaliculata]|uniref:uncharacterized protein LOC112564562 n=1 Tax=Pomacea canaliculata TaxID=400727 RepID=UPI000D72BD05|nr:uncharacterized protein LOC112564562 [Pomacea canaliculata]
MSWMSADMRRMLIVLHLLLLCMLKMAASNKLEICTPGKGYDCAVNATCVDRHCDCDLPLKGNGFLQCVHQEQMLCTVAEDLQVTAFQGASAHIYLPCRYRIAEFYTRYNGSDMATHYCFFRVSGFNKIKDGHQHLGGFELIFFTMNNLKEEGFMKGFLKFSIDSLGIHSGNDTHYLGDLLRWTGRI